MTELVESYTSNGYVSEEQYELLLFKKAKKILMVEFEILNQKEMAKAIVNNLLLEQ